VTDALHDVVNTVKDASEGVVNTLAGKELVPEVMEEMAEDMDNAREPESIGLVVSKVKKGIHHGASKIKQGLQHGANKVKKVLTHGLKKAKKVNKAATIVAPLKIVK